jgi:hypothetical protein
MGKLQVLIEAVFIVSNYFTATFNFPALYQGF